jgi:hypothetical protein
MKMLSSNRHTPDIITTSMNARACSSIVNLGNRCARLCPDVLCSHNDDTPITIEANNKPSPKDSSSRIGSGVAVNGKSHRPGPQGFRAGGHLIRWPEHRTETSCKSEKA